MYNLVFFPPKGASCFLFYTLGTVRGLFNNFIDWWKFLFFFLNIFIKSTFRDGESAHGILFSVECRLNSVSHKAVMPQLYKLVLRKDWCSLPRFSHIYSIGVSRLKPPAL